MEKLISRRSLFEWALPAQTHLPQADLAGARPLLQCIHLRRQFVDLRSEYVEHFALHVKFLLAHHVHA